MQVVTRDIEIGKLLRTRFASYQGLPAIWLDGQEITYAKVFSDAANLAQQMLNMAKPGARIGILAQRSYPAYVGVLASVLSGCPYVPINMKTPLDRQLSIASIADCRLLISDDYSKRRSEELIQRLGPGVKELNTPSTHSSVPVRRTRDVAPVISGSATAYIMFTSGTTGAPKGVAVRRENLSSYLAAISEIAPIELGTRCTQNFDLSFDLSVHDIFQTWASGGCLYIMSNEETLDPVGFAKKHALQAWFSVPSVINMAQRLKRIVPGALPDLRLSLFCGEALSTSAVECWAEVAPNSRILNLYGPTEATIAITAKEYTRESNPKERGATVPLGEAFPNSAAVVVNEDRQPALLGELWLGGAQISDGYINNEEEQRRKFIDCKLPGHSYDRWYRTGDIIRINSNNDLVFQGRLDDQAKIQGYRVELLEIEEALRQVSGTSEVAAVLWPITNTGAAEGLVGFVCSAARTEREIIADCRAHLPTYAVPRKVIFVDALPLNANGKVDRKALRDRHLVSG